MWQTYWKDSTVFHESAECESSGRGMKSWYLSFHVDEEAAELMEGFLTADGVPWMSEVECEVPGRRSTVDSLCSIVLPLATLSDGVDVCSTLRDLFVFCFGIVYAA